MVPGKPTSVSPAWRRSTTLGRSHILRQPGSARGGNAGKSVVVGRLQPGLHSTVVPVAMYLLVTDIDERFLVESAALNQPMIEIQRHDIVTDPLPSRSFDLIHERLVLFHVPAREQALERMVSALKPDSWIVIEAFDRNFNDFSYPSTNTEGAALRRQL